MIDIDKYIDSLYINWVKRLINTTDEDANWKVIPMYHLNKFGPKFLIFNMNIDRVQSIQNLKDNIPEFYLEVIKKWIKFNENKEMDEINFKSIRQQVIWGNKHIKFNGKCLIYNNWIKDNILYINDILDENGKISQNFLLNKLSNHCNWFSDYTKLIKAIPLNWKKVLQTDESIKTKIKTILFPQIRNDDGKKVNFQDLSLKQIYNMQNKTSHEKPVGFVKWEKQIKTENQSFKRKKTFLFIFYYLDEPKYKIFKWKILHYILPCKQLLLMWKLVDSSLCNVCNELENYEHFFITCKYFENFWNNIKILLDALRIGHHTVCMTTLVYGYKITDKDYYGVNYLFTVIFFTIYKVYYISDQKRHKVNAFKYFTNALLEICELRLIRNPKIYNFFQKVVNILKNRKELAHL